MGRKWCGDWKGAEYFSRTLKYENNITKREKKTPGYASIKNAVLKILQKL
jgi:hypothetical protein